MSQQDAFTLPRSGLNAFLFAEVGTETNGSPLTILSTLARLGQDPWAQAAQWAKAPRDTIVDGLARCIAQMPLDAEALRDAHATAARLVLLLPTRAAIAGDTVTVTAARFGMPSWLPMALLYLGLAAAAAFGVTTLLRSAATTGDTVTRGSDRMP